MSRDTIPLFIDTSLLEKYRRSEAILTRMETGFRLLLVTIISINLLTLVPFLIVAFNLHSLIYARYAIALEVTIVAIPNITVLFVYMAELRLYKRYMQRVS